MGMGKRAKRFETTELILRRRSGLPRAAAGMRRHLLAASSVATGAHTDQSPRAGAASVFNGLPTFLVGDRLLRRLLALVGATAFDVLVFSATACVFISSLGGSL